MGNATGEIRTVERGHKYRIRVRLEPSKENPTWHWSKMRTIDGNKAQANAALVSYKNELLHEKKDIPKTIKDIVNQFQENRIALNKVSPLTIQRDSKDLQRIIKYLGDMETSKLSGYQIEKAYVKIKKNENLSDYGIYRIHHRLKHILNQAVQEGTIDRNPCLAINGIKLPRVDEKTKKTKRFTLDQIKKLSKILQESDKDGYIVSVWLALTTGMRRGEILALHWGDVDLENGRIFIDHQYGKEKKRKNTKTSKSKRVISIDKTTVKYLEDWKKQQQKVFDKLQLKVSDNSPVCSNINGQYIDPDLHGRWRRNFFVKNGFAKFNKKEEWTDSRGIKRYKYSDYQGPTFHALRNAQATMLVAGGVDPKTVQARLGHEQITTTLQIYAEAVEENDKIAADFVEKFVS